MTAARRVSQDANNVVDGPNKNRDGDGRPHDAEKEDHACWKEVVWVYSDSISKRRDSLRGVGGQREKNVGYRCINKDR